MGLDKYKFVPGEKYPAENASSIDPDNIQPQSAGYLIGGNNVSALSVFQSLAIGANDGKFKMNIDGNIYDNVTADLVKTAWALTGTTESSKYLSQLSGPLGLFFKSDGSKMYTADGYLIKQFSLSTSWDDSTIAYEKSFNVGFSSAGLFFKPDGTKMYVVSETGTVYQYSLSTAFDIATASYDSVSFSLTGQMTEARTIKFKPDGTTFIVLKYNSRILYQYNLSTAWDLSTASYSGKSLTIGGSYNSYFFDIRPDGSEIYVHTQYSNAYLSSFTISTPWDLSTASTSDSATITFNESNIVSIFFKPDGSKMYSAKYTYIHQYSTGTVIESFSEIATRFQSAIRALTGKTETVEYDTDHFIITSATKNRKSQVLKLMTPSTGTDISGAGATPYLDCADNATETLGTGEDYNLVRLNSNGELDGSNLINLKNANTNFVVLPSTIIRTTGGSKYITSSTVIKVKEIEYKNISGRIKILWGATGNNNNNASAQIYKNGLAVGINRTTLGNSAYTYEEDFDVNSGDLIQIYGSGNNGLTINYFNLCYLKTLKTESDVINL